MSKTRVNNIEPFSTDQLHLLGKGIYIPKLTTVQRDAVLAPEDGLTIYNTTTHAVEHYNSATSAWESVDGIQTINGRASKNQVINTGSNGLAPAVTPSGTDTNTINIPNARATDVTAGLISKAEYDSFNIRRFPVKNVVYVVKNTVLGPQDFNTLTAALASINDASASNPYKIEIGPGIYEEDTIIMKSWVWVEGAEQDQTVLKPTNPADTIIEGAPNSGISKCLITGATSGVGVEYMSSVGDDRNSFFIEDCRFGSNQTQVISDSTNSMSGIFIEESHFGGDYQFTTGFVARNGGRIVMRNSGTTSVFTTVPDDVFLADGANSEIVINAVQCRNGNAAAGNAIRVRNGAKVRVLSFNVKGWAKGIYAENAGAAPYIQVYGIMNQENTVDLQVDHPGTDGIYGGSADHTKITINSSASVAVSITSNAASASVGTVVAGSTLQGDRYDRLANLSLLSRKSATLGVIEDVEQDFVQVISGLQIQVNAGRGFLNDPTDLFLKEIAWPNTPLTLGAHQSYYIYVDTNQVVQFSPSFPGLQSNILLGRVNTHASGIRFIENSDMSMNHYGNRAEDFFRMVLGPVFKNGCIVTENASPRKLDLTAGSYQYGVGQFVVTGGSAITFEAFYKDGSGGFTSVAGQDTLSNTQYDDGTGTLASIPAGHYARHHLYLMEDRYFVIFAQETYAALADALTAPLPTIPSFMTDAVVRIAGVIVQEGVANIYSSVIDIRPRIGFAAPSGTAVTDHGSLTGLNDVDDHPGYLTLNGLRPMTGNLDMGGQNITNVNLVDGVDISAHAARHLPNGADPIATAAPTTAVGGGTTNQVGTANTLARSDHQHDVATGTPSTQIPDQANAEGSSNNLARADHTHNVPTGTPVQVGTANAAGAAATFSKSDHVHNHGNQTNPAHHAVATTGANGFMSSTDKTKIDTIETGATADQIASEVPFTPVGSIAATDVQAALAEVDSEKVPKTTQVNAGTGLTGGGDLSANRTISMPNTGTAGTYGAADTVPVTTTDAQGRVTGVTNTAIAILAAAVTNFAASVRGTLLAGYAVGSNVALDVADSILVAFGKVQAQLNAKANLAGGNTFTGGTQTITPTLATDTALAVTQGRTVLGGTTPQDITGLSAIPIFQIQGLSAVQMAGIQYSADTIGPVFNLLKSRGATLYSQGLVLADDEFGRIQFRGSDGNNFQAGASIRALVDGTAAAGSMPGRLIMMTTPTGSTTPVERMRISQDGLVRVVDALQKRRSIQDFDTIATANTTTTLTIASASRQIITGTTAGQIVRMPNATLLTVGAEYEVRNTATVTVAVQDNAGGALDTTPAGSGITVLILTANGTAAGTWVARTRFEPFFQDVTATANHVVNTTGDTLVTGMTITPQAGIYDVQFDGVLSNTTGANGQTIGYGVYVDTTAQTGSDRAHTLPTTSLGNITPGSITITTGFTVTVNGSQAINIRARRAAGTVGITGRRMKITRVG